MLQGQERFLRPAEAVQGRTHWLKVKPRLMAACDAMSCSTRAKEAYLRGMSQWGEVFSPPVPLVVSEIPDQGTQTTGLIIFRFWKMLCIFIVWE